jgi:DNA polymerase III epsilon subunit-like protein
MVDKKTGKLVGEPLKRGGSYCLFHTVIFCATEVSVEDAIVVFLDLETTGLSIILDHIVEMGVVANTGEVFSTVVKPPVLSSIPSVHGIEDTELAKGPAFPEAFARLVRFLDGLSENALSEDESSTDELAVSHLKSVIPDVILVAHNGIRFDFPMLLSECYRCNMPLDAMNNWKYADTIAVARVLDPIVFGGCMKLQCMLHISAAHDLRAHRALDDAIALQSVTTHLSDALGVSILRLLEFVVVQLDAPASLAQLSVVI